MAPDTRMLAAVVDRYGPPEVVRVAEVPAPVPRPDEVLVRVRAAAVTSGDARIRAARFPPGFGVLARLAFGLVRPRRSILGGTFSGVVDAVGERVHDLAPGDEVCGMSGTKMGAHAELVAVAATRVTRKPPRVTHEDAAGVLFGGTAALHFLRDKASVGQGGNVVAGSAPERAADFAVLLELVADGELTVVIDKTYDLADIVEAYRRVDSGHKVGNVIVRP